MKRQFNQYKLDLWVTSLSDTPRLQYYDVQTTYVFIQISNLTRPSGAMV
jgi:hypothetical protein